MSEIVFSPAQEAILARRGTNIVVSASAGSGKTSVLVERLTRLILQDFVSVEKILAVTFTNDAAAEMKSRLRLSLQKAGSDAWISSQLAFLEDASICTIDSFCADLLRRYGAHLPYSSKQLSTLILDSQKNQAVKKAYEQALNTLEAEDFARLRIYLQAYRQSDEDLQKTVLKLIETAKAKPDPAAWIRQLPKSSDQILPWFHQWFSSRLTAMTECLDAILERLQEEEYSKEAKRQSDIKGLEEKKQVLEALRERLDAEGYPSFRTGFIEYISSTAKVTPSYNKHSYKEEQSDLKKLETDIAQALFDWKIFSEDQKYLQLLKQTLCTLTLAFMEAYQQIKKDMEVIDYSDMEHFAYELLQMDLVAQELKDQYEVILIDEFQDTNDLQEAVISRFARENNVFCVGDIKQSIYSFRQARPEIMKRHMESDDGYTAMVMAENYRSNENLIAFNNDFYSRLMNHPCLGGQFSSSDLARCGSERQKSRTQVPVRFLFSQYQAYSAEHDISLLEAKKLLRRSKADMIARDILAHHKNGMEYRSMCILTRSHTTHEEIKTALEAYQIPVLAEIDHGFYTNQAIQIVLAALKVLDNPYDDIAMTAFLCSPLGALSHAMLAAALEDRSPKCSIYTHLKGSSAKNLARRPILSAYKELKAIRYTSIADLLKQIYNYQDFYYRSTSGQDKTNLDLLMEMAQQEGKEGSLQAFLSRMDKESGLDKTSEAAIYGKEENVVQIKTMHHAKGLQFPLVYLWSRESLKDMEAAQPILIDADLGLGLRSLDSQNVLKRPSMESLAIECKHDQEDMEEEIRLLYVATTRAEEELVIVDSIKSLSLYEYPLNTRAMMNNRSYTSWLLHTYLNETSSPVVFEEVKEVPERPEKKTFVQKWQPLPHYQKSIRVLSSQTASSAKQVLHWQEPVVGRNTAAEHGTLIHDIVENIPYPYTKEQILAFAGRRNESVSGKDISQILALNENTRYKKWMAGRHSFETSYIVSLEGQLLHGFMDFTAEEEDTIQIVDFKTDALEHDEDFIRRYGQQLALYKKAMQAISSDKNIQTWIYSFHMSRLIPMDASS